MFAPYKIDSRAGRRATDMSGRHDTGMNRDVKYVRTHVKTGVAGTKNWDVNGMRRATMYIIGMPSLSGKPGDCISVSQNMAFNMWRRYIVSENVNVCWRRRVIESRGDKDLSSRPTAAMKACKMVRSARDIAMPGWKDILASGTNCGCIMIIDVN